jgi:sugar/nucleoside kinase (ribokinase family)
MPIAKSCFSRLSHPYRRVPKLHHQAQPARGRARAGSGGAAPYRRGDAEAAARQLAAQNRRPVFLTLGENGIAVVAPEAEGVTHVPAIPLAGPLDPVGAGDSATAGIVPALCAGASLVEAAQVGNLVASITVRQIGTTGTATRAEVLAQWRKPVIRLNEKGRTR